MNETEGVTLIKKERNRQIGDEGYDSAHDAGHAEELARAGACYANAVLSRRLHGDGRAPNAWPWAARYWKPTPDDRIRELVKAGALIAAAIDDLLAEQQEGMS